MAKNTARGVHFLLHFNTHLFLAQSDQVYLFLAFALSILLLIPDFRFFPFFFLSTPEVVFLYHKLDYGDETTATAAAAAAAATTSYRQ